ncbi:MAG TPA: HDOD domain-containing protein, partial [Chitinivibrionales bacterium]
EFFPTIFTRTLEATATGRTQFIKAEKDLLGITHNDMMADLFAKWKLPDSVGEGVVSHYQYHEFNSIIDTPGKKIALCVGLADTIAKSCGLGKECDEFVEPVENWVWAALRMPAGISKSFLDDVGNQMKLYGEFLKMGKQESGPAAQEKASAEKVRIGTSNPAKDIFIAPQLYAISQGYTVTPFAPDALKNAQGKFHCIVLWTQQATTAETLAQFSKTVKYSETAAQGDQPPVFAPIIAFVDPAGPLYAKKNEFPNVTMLNKSFDLREMDAYILQAMQDTYAPQQNQNPTVPVASNARAETRSVPVENVAAPS